MDTYEIRLTRRAEADFRKLPREIQRRFARALDLLREDPWNQKPDCDVRKLSTTVNAWRVRVGQYRGIYAIQEATIVFTRFGHRKSVYRP